MESNEIEIDLGRAVKVLYHQLWWILILVVITYGLSTIVFREGKVGNMYSANATVYSASKEPYKGAIESKDIMSDYSKIIKTLKVCDRAALLLGDDSIDGITIMNSIETYFSQDSSILTIQAVNADPEMAVKIANAVASTFVIEMNTITGSEEIKMLDKAYTYQKFTYSSNSIKIKRFITVAFVLILLCGGVIIYEIFTRKIKGISECTLDGELPILGIVPIYKD